MENEVKGKGVSKEIPPGLARPPCWRRLAEGQRGRSLVQSASLAHRPEPIGGDRRTTVPSATLFLPRHESADSNPSFVDMA